jgi:protein-disulfide isomerase
MTLSAMPTSRQASRIAKIRKEKKMVRRILLTTVSVLFLSLYLTAPCLSQEDQIVQVAIETLKTQARLPKGTEVKFIEKKESPIPGFYSVKLSVMTQTREIPVIIYVDSAGEKVMIGNIFIKGENVTQKEAGEPKPRKMDMGQLGIEKSPFRGSGNAKMTVVEFSNFQCPFCVKSWKKMKELLEKNPQDIKYVFKHFPLQPHGKPFQLSEMVAATQEVSHEAFWAVHDFFFSDEGQGFVGKETAEVLKQKIEEILKGKGYDEKAFQTALETGKGKKRVEEDMILGNKIGVRGTPTMVINGDFVGSTLTDKMIEQYLGK